MQTLKRFLFGLGLENPLPDEMKKDPLLKDLKVSGPFGPSHDRLRHVYYAKRDGETIPYSCCKIKSDYEYMTDGGSRSGGVWVRSDDTPKELHIICNAAKEIIDSFCDASH